MIARNKTGRRQPCAQNSQTQAISGRSQVGNPGAYRAILHDWAFWSRLSALAAFTVLPLALPASWLRRLAGLPSLTPRALAALGRWEFITGLRVELGKSRGPMVRIIMNSKAPDPAPKPDRI
jgi:hypothetical protein